MADKVTRAQRSYNMSRIRKFGNASTEQRPVQLFRQHGIKGWRRHLLTAAQIRSSFLKA
jgi:hypothetical protein